MGGPTLEAFRDAGVINWFIVEGTFQAALGFLAGWYGGYLRRRQTQVGAGTRTTRRR